MDNQTIFEKAVSALGEGRPVALVTVVSVVGSTPGKVGYKMLVLGEGRRIVGTVGGGLTEARMIEEAAGMLGEPRSRLFHFDLGGTPDEEKGICGGSIDLLVETFDPAALPLFADFAEAARSDRNAVAVSIIAGDGLPRKLLVKNVGQVEAANAGLAPEIVAVLKRAATLDETGTRISTGGMDVFIEPLMVRPRLILFGAGHVAGHIARFARSVHFHVTVCDDRPEYANAERFPDAEEIVIEDFSRVFDSMRIDERSYIVIVTRGHKHDGIVLERAVQTGARYVGMIGSRRKTLTLLENLRAGGIPKERLDRVYAPIGIDIGAVTAEEIALSIVCELVKIRRLGDEAGVGHMTLSRPGASHD